MASRPTKRLKTGKNGLSHIKSFQSLGLSIHQKGDDVITHSRISSDGRRIHDRIVTAAPCRQRLHTTIKEGNDWMDFEDSADFEANQQRDRMVFQVRKGRVIRVPKRKLFQSDRPMKTFVKNKEDYLTVQMILKGRGDHVPDKCVLCPSDRESIEPTFRCVDCTCSPLICQDCCVERHQPNPFHRIEVNHWTGHHFEKVSLRRLGLVTQLGHQDGTGCQNPVPGPSKFIVVHENGIHRISLQYCGCTASISSQTGALHQKWEQLMRNQLFPTTHTRPRTACTFQMLEKFHSFNLSGKINPYDYYKGLRMITDNTGAKLPNRYPSVLRATRQWRHLRMLRRGGRGNDGDRSIAETRAGELAVDCIACPKPGINLPVDWTTAPIGVKFIYTMFVAIDACFRLKRKRISSWARDPSLQDGWAYFVENGPYGEWIQKMKDQKEISTCTGLAALDHANTKFHEGYDETGKVAGLCARHEILLKNGMGATQVGERYANTDFIVGSFLRHISILLILVLSYDIVCQWCKKAVKRLKKLPSMIRLNILLRIVKFVIPKLHILGHLIKCQEKFSLSYTPGVGQTDAESIERFWSGLGTISTSVKEMGPGSHHDTLEDHIGHWNWSKVTGMGALLKKRLTAAVEEFERQLESCAEFSRAQPNNVSTWKAMVDDYESQTSDFNPYASPFSGKTAQTVRLELAKEAEAKARQEIITEEKRERNLERNEDDADADADREEADYEDDPLPDLETSPGEFLFFGLEIEHQQRELRQDILSIKAPTNKQLTAIVDRRTKLTRQIKRFRALQFGYMPVSLQVVATLPPSKSHLNAEDIPLYLPSKLQPEMRASKGCAGCLPEMELRLRDGQLNQYLNQLRQSLLVKQRMLCYKKANARNQGPTTRSRAMIIRQEKKVKLAALSYQEAWRAKLALVEGDKEQVGWKELLQEHIMCMEDLQDVEKKKAKAMKQKRKEAVRRALNGENPVQGAREKHRVPSWIWHFSSEGELCKDQVLYDGLRIEWCKSYARVKRWHEEILLLQEEMRRCLVTLEWQAKEWEGRAEIDTFEGERKEGAAAYAYRQAEVKRSIAARFEELWGTKSIAALRHYKPEMDSIYNIPIPNTVGAVELRTDDESDDQRGGWKRGGRWEEDGEKEEDGEDEDGEEEEDFGDDQEGRIDGDDEEDMNDEDEPMEEQYAGLTIKGVLIAIEEVVV
ncbi:hypothetical protein VKT23_016505 [Stygiomarasmius scandens]|uniref:CxC2-like cysteine cluster KDZ transposase-associated domain-containing protein n=1 Tax=Marasmiellus scandens TaxID=2682957 RepID=A0ABR1IUM0_9AGAR